MGVVFEGEVRDIFRGGEIPPIYDICKTVDMLASTDCSFSRFGDGEFTLMMERDEDITFQKGSQKLADRLKEVITSNEKDVEIGINRIYFYNDGFDHPYITNFIYKKGYGKRLCQQKYIDVISKRDHYYDSVISIPTHHYALGRDFFDSYFEKVKSIWKDRNIVLVTGDIEIMKYDFNIFAESAKNVRIVELSKTDAFDYHGRIVRYINSLGLSKKNDILLLVCGLEATILAYDLAEMGYRALDIGHIAKEYNNYRHNIMPYSRDDNDFFA